MKKKEKTSSNFGKDRKLKKNQEKRKSVQQLTPVHSKKRELGARLSGKKETHSAFEQIILPSGIKIGLLMNRIKGRRGRVTDPNQQRENPIPVPTLNKYPEGAVPDIIKPVNAPELRSCKSDQIIQDPRTALDKNSVNEHLSFDEAIEQLRASENLADEEEILYVGQGKFAVVHYEQKGKKKTMQILRIIEFEHRQRQEWREKLLYAVRFIEIEEAATLGSLYSSEEISSFSEFNGG